MGAQECFDKTYVKLYYIPPKDPKPAADCKQVKVTKSPEIRIFTGQISKLEGIGRGDTIGVDIVCSVVSTEGAGGVILLLQISAYIEWEIEFVPASPQPNSTPAPWVTSPKLGPLRPSLTPPNSTPAPWVNTPATPPATPAPLPPIRETHRVFVSVPMLHKIEGPRIALMAISPIKLKLPVYAAKIYNAFSKLREVDQVMGVVTDLVTSTNRGFCPTEVRVLELALPKLEKELDRQIRRLWSSGGGDGEIVMLMRGKEDGAGRFPSYRLV